MGWFDMHKNYNDCDNCGSRVSKKEMVCPHCLMSSSDKQLPLDELVNKANDKSTNRLKQNKYEFKSHNYWKNKHNIR
tara:strand:- start:393 stop:623 length:231 start_codon:yes stop_codon:yes gene_type:complete